MRVKEIEGSLFLLRLQLRSVLLRIKAKSPTHNFHSSDYADNHPDAPWKDVLNIFDKQENFVLHVSIDTLELHKVTIF